MKKLFVLCMYTDWKKTRIGYCGLFDSKQQIIKNIPYLNYNDLTFKRHKYRTSKSLFTCIEIKQQYKYLFNSYHLCDHNR